LSQSRQKIDQDDAASELTASSVPRCTWTTNHCTLVVNWINTPHILESSTFLSAFDLVSPSSPSRNTVVRRNAMTSNHYLTCSTSLVTSVLMAYEVSLDCHFELLRFLATPSVDRSVRDAGRINQRHQICSRFIHEDLLDVLRRKCLRI
jgi:hypothetical protein